MKGLREEFPDFDPATLPAIPEGWIDASWHNDTCPCFEVITDKVYVFIDYEKVEDREHGYSDRFSVKGKGGDFSTNDWQAVLAEVAKRKAA